MKTELIRIARDTTIYAAANVIGRLAGLVLIPLYAYRLSIDDYALYTVLVATMELAALVLGLGLNGAMGRFFFERPDDTQHQNLVVSTVFIGFALLAVALVVAVWQVTAFASAKIFGPAADGRLFAYVILAVLLTIQFELASGYFLIRKRPLAVLLLSIGKFVLLLGANYAFVVVLGFGVAGVVYAMLSSFALVAIPASVGVLIRTGLRFDRRIIAGVLGYGIPLVPSAAANAMMRVVERQLLLAGGAIAVGRYGLADRLASLLQMFIAAPFSQVFFVRRFETLARGEGQHELERVLLIFVAVMAAAGLALAAFGPEILSIVAPVAFRGAAELLPWLALSFVLASLNLNIELGILYAKRTMIVPIIGTIALAASVSLNFLLIPLYGAMGAAVTAVIVGIVRLLLTVVANGRWGTPDVSTNWPRVALVLTSATLLGILATSQSLAPLTLTTLAIRAALWLLFALALLLSLVPNPLSVMMSRALPKRSSPQGG